MLCAMSAFAVVTTGETLMAFGGGAAETVVAGGVADANSSRSSWAADLTPGFTITVALMRSGSSVSNELRNGSLSIDGVVGFFATRGPGFATDAAIVAGS